MNRLSNALALKFYVELSEEVLPDVDLRVRERPGDLHFSSRDLKAVKSGLRKAGWNYAGRHKGVTTMARADGSWPILLTANAMWINDDHTEHAPAIEDLKVLFGRRSVNDVGAHVWQADLPSDDARARVRKVWLAFAGSDAPRVAFFEGPTWMSLTITPALREHP